jgi:hypothetical protein
MLSPRGLTRGLEKGLPKAFPEIKSSIPERNASNWAIEFVDSDKSNIYVAISGLGNVGKVSSERIDLRFALIDAQPLNVIEAMTIHTKIEMLL